jgi:arylsulfatase A
MTMIYPTFARHIIFVLALLGLAGRPEIVHAAPPNIILIMADDLGYECIGANGSTHYKTPRIDALASEGMRFTHAYSQPLCTPSRVQLMTGKHNFRNYTKFAYMNPEEKTFAHALKDAGYKTAIVGKWQLGFDSTLPPRFGFDEHCLWQLSARKPEGERYANPLIEQNGKRLPRDPDAYGPDIFCDFAMDFVSRSKDAPFFLYYPMALTHNPFVPTPDSAEWGSGDRYADDPKHFAEMVTYMDKNIGRLVDHVASLGLAENTLFLFTGDNGTNRNIASPFQGRMLQGDKGAMTDAGTHVPLIAWWAGTIKPGQTFEGLVGFEDFFPTLLDVGGVSDYKGQLDGRSFLPLLKGQAYEPKPWHYSHYDPRWGDNRTRRGRTARTTDYKLYAGGPFFHIPTDPDEARPLDSAALSPEAANIRAMLQQVLDDFEKQGSVMSADGAPESAKKAQE